MRFEEELKGVIKKEPLYKYTTVGIGGKADYLYLPNSSCDLLKVVKIARKYKLPFKVIGKGSNTLICDTRVKGLIIVNITGNHIIIDDTDNDTFVICDSGVPLQKLSTNLFKINLLGLENFSGIPCSVGGAVFNNIHGVDKMFSDLIEWVEYIDTDNNILRVTKDKCEFGYDESTFQNNNGIILRVCLKLEKGDGKKAFQYWNELRKKKLLTQPQRSLGCVFKNFTDEQIKKYGLPNPSVGWFIENKLQMTGYRIGDAVISPKHHNFIENVGNASCKDYKALINEIIKKARELYKIKLEPEIEYYSS